MSDILRTIDHMRGRGVSAEAILEAVYALEASRADKLEQRRSDDRMRQRRARAKRDPVNTEIVSRDTDTVTAGNPPGGFPFPEPLSLPNPPSLSLSSSAGTREERLAAQRDLQQNHWKEILATCKQRVNGSMSAGPAAMDISPIIRLMAPMEDEPCDLQADILPAIDFKVAQSHKTGKPIGAWSWIEERARHNRDARLKPPPEPEKIHERAGQGAGNGAAHGAGSRGARSGEQYFGTGVVAAAARRNRDRQAQDHLPDRPEDRRDERVA